MASDWELPCPFDWLALESDEDWETLAARYLREGAGTVAHPNNRPLLRCLEVARAAGAKTVVIETRYIDLDYRSEFSAFYSKAFATHYDSAQRLHFFRDELEPSQFWDLPRHADGEVAVRYLGFMVVRPPPIRGIVGRTMLRPPPSFEGLVRTAVKAKVTFFGQRLEVRAVPFMQQEARLGSCAHAASWMCHYSAHLGDRQVPRVAAAEFSLAVNPGLGLGRLLPSTGLTLHQISDVLGALGLPPIHYKLDELTDNDRPEAWPNRHSGPTARVARTVCRYLNGGLPALVVVRSKSGRGLHAVVVCGYRRTDRVEGGATFLVNDDRRGPYLPVLDVFNDEDAQDNDSYTWENMLVPVPEKLWLTGEAAERKGCEHLLAAARKALDDVPACQALLDALDDGNDDLTVRTYAIASSRLKRRFRDHQHDQVALEAYSVARMPRYVWVVEAIQRSLRDAATPAVLAEVIFDATSEESHPIIIGLRLPGLVAVPQPENPEWDHRVSADPVKSSGQFSP